MFERIKDNFRIGWDGLDSSGDETPSGNYIVRGTAEGRSASVRFVKL